MKKKYLYHIILTLTLSLFITSCGEEEKEKESDKATNLSTASDTDSDAASGTDSDAASGTDSDAASDTNSGTASDTNSDAASDTGSDAPDPPNTASSDSGASDNTFPLDNQKLIEYLNLIAVRFEIEGFRIDLSSGWCNYFLSLFGGCSKDVYLELYHNNNPNNLQVLFRVINIEDESESLCSMFTYNNSSVHNNEFDGKGGLKITPAKSNIISTGNIEDVHSIHGFNIGNTTRTLHNTNSLVSLSNLTYGTDAEELVIKRDNIINPSSINLNFNEALSKCGWNSL